MDKKDFDKLSIEEQTHFIIYFDKIIETNPNWIVSIAQFCIYISMFILLIFSLLYGEVGKEVLDGLANLIFIFFLSSIILAIVGLTYEFTYRRKLINQKLNDLYKKYNKNGKRK